MVRANITTQLSNSDGHRYRSCAADLRCQARSNTTPHFLILKNTKWCVDAAGVCTHDATGVSTLSVWQVFDLFTVPSYNGYMAAAYKNYTIDWTPKVVRLVVGLLEHC